MTRSASKGPQDPSPPHGRVVVGLEDPDRDVAPLRWAAAFARDQQLPVLVVHSYQLIVIPAVPVGYVAPVLHEEEQHANAEAVTARAVDALREQGVDASGMTVCDDAGHALLAASHPADILVLGTAGGGPLRHALRGGTMHTVLHGAACPVVAVPTGWDQSSASDRVVVGDDGSRLARTACRWAARHRGAGTLEIVRVRDAETSPPSDHDHGDLGSGVTAIELPAGRHSPVEQLLAVATGARMLVVGNHRTGWLGAVTGHSGSEQAVLDPSCPVIVVPPEQEDET